MWLSRCGFCTSNISCTRALVRQGSPQPHPRPAESGRRGWGPRSLVFNKPSGWFCHMLKCNDCISKSILNFAYLYLPTFQCSLLLYAHETCYNKFLSNDNHVWALGHMASIQEPFKNSNIPVFITSSSCSIFLLLHIICRYWKKSLVWRHSTQLCQSYLFVKSSLWNSPGRLDAGQEDKSGLGGVCRFRVFQQWRGTPNISDSPRIFSGVTRSNSWDKQCQSIGG